MSAEITKATLDMVKETIHDDAVVQELQQMTLTDGEVDFLAYNLSLLWGSAGVDLWPDTTTWLRLEKDEILRDAERAARRTRHMDEQVEGFVIRDSITMVLEVIHAAKDPMVFRDNPEQWLWSPLGPPISGQFGNVNPEQRYDTHAQTLGLKWDEIAMERFSRHESYTMETIATQTMGPINDLPAAVSDGRSSLQDLAPLLEECLQIASSNPQGPWPEVMSSVSAAGWSCVEKMKRATEVTMKSASATGVTRVLQASDTIPSNEEFGIMVAAERARPATLWRIWTDSEPTPLSNADKKISLWQTSQNPVDYWAACMTAALLELGRSRHGDIRGVALALVNR